MPRPKRKEQFPPDEISLVHCIQRCVRRAFLCGEDVVTGKSFEHRREWIRLRLEELAAVFAVDVFGYGVMSNHLHAMLRSRPDIVEARSDDDVLSRWHRAFPGYRIYGLAPPPTEKELKKLRRMGKKKIAKIRERISSISWFMRALAEPIARRANEEDQCTGRFWEGRFRCHRLLDEVAIVACLLYVEINAIRAKLASTPEDSEFTSAYDRILAAQGKMMRSAATQQLIPRDAWLSPLQLVGECSWDPMVSTSGVRASDKGCIEVPPDRYWVMLDWVGRQNPKDKPGKIPPEVQPILDRLGVRPEHWCEYVQNFGKTFRRASGSPTLMEIDAQKNGHKWAVGTGSARKVYLNATA